MKLCLTCDRCYEDTASSCASEGHRPLVRARFGTRLIGGKYRLDRLIGRGGMGAVFEGIHVGLNEPRAIKLILPEYASADPNSRERLRREAQTAGKVHHPNVVLIYDIDTNVVEVPSKDGGTELSEELFVVMELLKGQTLKSYLAAKKVLQLDEAIEIARQVAEGLRAIHEQGFLYRDMKPANVMLTRDYAGRLLVKILDFGAVKIIRESAELKAVDLTGALFVGSAQYASPENCKNLPQDERSDIYGLGLILFEMLAERPTFPAGDFDEVLRMQARVPAPPLEGVWPPLANLIAKALEKDPALRPQSASDFARYLNELAARLERNRDKGRVSAAADSPTRAMGGALPASKIAQDEEQTRAAVRVGNETKRHPPSRRGTAKAVKVGATSSVASSTVPAALVLLLVVASVFVFGGLARKEALPSATPSSAATTDANPASGPSHAINSEVGDELTTSTDVNIRSDATKGSKKIGLAEKGSRVRVLDKKKNWRKIVVLSHGRDKKDPDSADQGWIDGSTLSSDQP